MSVTRRNRVNRKSRSSGSRNGSSRSKSNRNSRNSRNSKKGGYRMYKFWTHKRILAFVNALVAKDVIADPGSVSDTRGLELLAEVAGVSVTELQNNINPIHFGKVYLGQGEMELERGLLKGPSESGFMNQMDELRKEKQWANVAAFNKLNFGNIPEEGPLKNKRN